MVDRRLEKIRELEKILIEKNPDWGSALTFEEPPVLNSVSMYDLAIPCFALSKSRRLPPADCAQQVCDQLKAEAESLGIEKIEVVKGYLNLRFEPKVFSAALMERTENILGKAKEALKGEKIVIDFSSPNIAKPFGIGHLRSTNIGAALGRIFRSLGAEVVGINHLGDWGTQFGKIITAYKRFGSAEFVKGDPVNNLYKLYVQFHEKEPDDPALIDEAREWFVRLEKGDEEALELWKWFKDVSYHEFKRIYDRLHVKFDHVTGESFYNQLMEKSVDTLDRLGLLKESEGAKIVDLEPYKMPPALIKKSDGSTLYITRDIAAAEFRQKTYSPTRLVCVVGAEQTLHFKQIFKVLELMGYEWAKNCVHIGFGLIRFPEGKMSTRKGNIILLEDVLNQAEKQALQIVQQKNDEKPEEKRLTPLEQIEVARVVGTGAVIFFDLHAKRMKDIDFDWESILSFEGDSGPYLQYTCVRLSSLLERAKSEGIRFSSKNAPILSTEEERMLTRAILGFSAVVEAAAREYEPSVVSHELLSLCGVFNRFYMNVPILKGDENLRAGRLQLVRLTLDTLLFGLNLLGIEVPKKM